MSKIRILSEKVANQIAAGEVIERPASVVRELLDNSIDAKADEISIKIEEGGKNLIRVRTTGPAWTVVICFYPWKDTPQARSER